MVTNDQIDRNREANLTLAEMVIAELVKFFLGLDLSRPEVARDALLAFVPGLVIKYGEVSQQIALEWYETMRPEGFVPSLPPFVDPTPAVINNVRYAAGHLFTPEPEKALGPLAIAVDKRVRQPGRDTIIWNAEQENVRWARVPTGEMTCSFCLVLASRGAVYISDRSAGSKDYGPENEFHGKCDCEILAFGTFDEYPAGYIPEDLYSIYEVSADAVGTRNDLKLILADVRRRFPDRVKDGVYDEDYLSRVG